MNADVVNLTNDLGKDGDTGSNIAKDAYGFALTYNDEDYTPIGTITAFVNSNTNGPGNIKNLYNGNIKQMITDVMDTNETALGIQVNHYGYDQLNRIRSMQGFDAGGAANYSSEYRYDRNGNLDSLKRATLNDVGQVVQMDDLRYKYDETKTNPITGEVSKNNQLNYVIDILGDTGFNDLASQSVDNYQYDEIGQLTSDFSQNITNINWRVDGKVASIIKTGGIEIHFKYDGLGNRIAKTVLPENKTTIYTRDAQGNVLAVYETNESDITNITANKTITLKEHHIYGSSRLGMEQKSIAIPEDGDTLIIQENLVLTTDNITTTQLIQAANKIDVAGGVNTFIVGATGNVTMRAGQVILKPGFSTVSGATFLAEAQSLDATLPENTFARKVGDKRYELSNHLGNVLSVVSDRKLVADPLNFTNFTADVLTYNDYYPFGMLLPNRHGYIEDYRYGFGGQEKDDEIRGEGNSLNYTFRMHDSRIGRFFTPDPLEAKFPNYSPYMFAGNRVILFTELEGLEETIPAIQNTINARELYNPKLDMDMSKVGSNAATINGNKTVASTYTVKNGVRNYIAYWNKQLEVNPQMFDPANTARIKNGAAPTVNDQWIKHNSAHADYKGDKLVHHHKFQGKVATAIPQSAHQKFTKVLHPFRRLKSGIANSLKMVILRGELVKWELFYL